MPHNYILKFKPSDEIVLWFLFIDDDPVENFDEDGQAPLTLADGEHQLSYEIHGAGGSIELDIVERPKIIMPQDETWPVTRAVPDGQTATSDAIYFRTEQ